MVLFIVYEGVNLIVLSTIILHIGTMFIIIIISDYCYFLHVYSDYIWLLLFLFLLWFLSLVSIPVSSSCFMFINITIVIANIQYHIIIYMSMIVYTYNLSIYLHYPKFEHYTWLWPKVTSVKCPLWGPIEEYEVGSGRKIASCWDTWRFDADFWAVLATCGGFLKWGYPKMVGWCGGTP